MGERIEKLVRFVTDTRWEEIPPAVQKHARLVLLDTFGVMLAGSEQSDVRRMQEGQKATAGTGATVYTRGWPTTDPGRAALLNALAARALELGELHLEVSSQAAVQIVPGALAAAETQRAGGRDLLTALVVAYELAIRVGAATTRRPLAHPTGQAALLGAIAAGARLRGLSATEASTAVRIGANLMVTGSYSNVVAGATALNIGGGMAGMAATLAPDLALAGYTAQVDAIEQAMESVVGDGFDPSRLLDDLGTRWEITRNFFRLRACCLPISPALDALEDALAALQPKPDEIERIDVVTYRFAAGMRNADPPSYFGAKYSLPHAAAALAINGHLRYESFTDTMVHDPKVAALRHRVHMTEDPEMTAALPRRKPARVTLTLKDGRQATHTSDDDRRMGKPHDEAAIREKFRALAGLVLTPEGVEAVEAAIDDCEQWIGVDPLIRALHRHGKKIA